MDKIKRYQEFASSLSFFEFIQDEFYPPRDQIKNYKEEVKIIQGIKIPLLEAHLDNLLQDHPRIFDIFESIFQQSRFSNTQIIHFLFNIEILNSLNEKKIIEYLVFNLESDPNFKRIFVKKYYNHLKTNLNNNGDVIGQDVQLMITLLKESVMDYIDSASKNHEWVYARIKLDDSSKRIAHYLINNLDLNASLGGIKLEGYLKANKRPKDTKSLHGKFGIIKLGEILKQEHILDANDKFKELRLNMISSDLSEYKELSLFKNKWIFVTEKSVNNLLNKKTNVNKKFDFILIYNLKIKYLIETNFYSTSGTKIGINESEYIDLNNEIQSKMDGIITFLWITDGNYWLTTDGESRFKRDLDSFSENILSYNLFKKRLKIISNN